MVEGVPHGRAGRRGGKQPQERPGVSQSRCQRRNGFVEI